MHFCRKCEQWKPYHDIALWTFEKRKGRGRIKRLHSCRDCLKPQQAAAKKRYQKKLKESDPERFRAIRGGQKQRYRAKYPERRKASDKKYRLKNREKNAAYHRRWYARRTPEEKRAKKQRYRENCMKRFGIPFTPKELARRREYFTNYARELTDGYVRGRIAKQSDILTTADIPDALVAVKREHIKMQRLLKERREGHA